MQAPTSENIDFLLKVAPLAVAFIAVFVGPLVQWRIAKRQFSEQRKTLDAQFAEQRRTVDAQIAAQSENTSKQIYANVRSTNRQAWINSLREEVAEYLATLNDIHFFLNREDGSERFLEGLRSDDHVIKDKFTRLTILMAAIELRLNPSEQDHIDLLKLLRSFPLKKDELANTDAFVKARGAAIRQCQKILKAEWDRVKKGE